MTSTAHRIVLAGSNAEFACELGDSLLRAAQRAGLGFPYECNVGSCANCRFELVQGEVQMNWPQAPGWTERDRQRHRYLGCQARPRSDCVLKLRLDPRCVPVHRPRRISARLEARRAITHDIGEFRFRLEQPQRFEPGQYALAYLPGVVGARAYSMSNASGEAGLWEFQVRRVPGGQGSAALFDAVAPGQSIELDGPYGMAYLRRAAPRDILCLAGGSGLAPMISIARCAMHEPALMQRRLFFLYGARTAADVCGEDMLRELPGWGQRLSYEAAVSHLADPPGAAWSGAVGWLHDVAQQRFSTQLQQMEIYFAGPPAMASAVQRMLHETRVPAEQIHFDQFY
ncbi:MAG: 2Fe-2S iron-sulfur cluster-binding protein [Burkholderiaceae bacterium]